MIIHYLYAINLKNGLNPCAEDDFFKLIRKNSLMEKRIGSILIVINHAHAAQMINQILSGHASIILGRQGLPLRHKEMNIISLVVEGEVEEINALSGQLGRIEQVQVKTVLTKPQANNTTKNL